jgi:trk system potassium uptake protein TrkA
MHKSFVVIGIGRFGGILATTLHKLGHEVLAIDVSEERINKIADGVTHAVAGDPRDEAVLKSVGVRNFDCAIVALSDDTQASILVTLMLKELGVRYVVSKAISDIHARVLKKVGADKIVFPEKDMGIKVAQSLAMKNILDVIELSDEFSIAEINTPSSWAGKSLRSINITENHKVNLIVLKKCKSNEICVSPTLDYVLSTEDVVVLIGKNENLKKITEKEI